MKRAATQLFKRQSKNRAFFKIIHELRPPADPRARRRSENPTPGTTRMCELGCPGRWSGLELTDNYMQLLKWLLCVTTT